MKKTVFTILAGLFLVALTGCKAETDNSVTYKTISITPENDLGKVQLIYHPDKDSYQIGSYCSPSYEWYTSNEKAEENKANTFEFLGNGYYKKLENQPVYSKNNTLYSYKAENEGDSYTKVEGLTCTLFTLFVFDLQDPTNEYQEDEMTFLVFTKEGKTYLAFVTEEAIECSYNINGTLRINNEKGKLFYKTNNKSPLEERDYNGTTIDNGKLFYVVDTYIE